MEQLVKGAVAQSQAVAVVILLLLYYRIGDKVKYLYHILLKCRAGSCL